MALIVTYYSDDRRTLPASFRVLVDGREVGKETQRQTEPPRFFDVRYAIPAELVRGQGPRRPSASRPTGAARSRRSSACAWSGATRRADAHPDEGPGGGTVAAVLRAALP